MKTRIILAALILTALTACGGTIQLGLEPLQSTVVVPTNTVNLPSPTTQPPTPTLPPATVPPTTEVPVTSTTDIPVADAPSVSMVKIYLIAMEDNGVSGKAVGCGDSAVAVDYQITPTQGVLRAALTSLLALKDQYYGQSGLYNALYQSNLQVESISISQGVAAVNLTGTLQLGGTCDIPRVKAQLEETVLQFPTVTSAAISINGKPLDEVLSLK